MNIIFMIGKYLQISQKLLYQISLAIFEMIMKLALKQFLDILNKIVSFLKKIRVERSPIINIPSVI